MLAIIAAIAGCDGEEHSASPTGKGCPGTRPSRTPPFPGEDFNYGNRYIGAALWQRGRLVASRGGTTWGQILPDGSIWAKVGWWRAVPGRLTIEGERLDGLAASLRAG